VSAGEVQKLVEQIRRCWGNDCCGIQGEIYHYKNLGFSKEKLNN
jgi:hypothetical protein